MKYTNSTTDKIYSKAYDCFLDEYLDGNERNVEKIRLQVGNTSLIHDLNTIGIKPGTETPKKIAENMPQNSILIYHKMNEAVEMYPERTGLLVVIKALDKTRVSFEYSGMGAIFRGFYNDWDDNPQTPKWSGWTNILNGGSGGSGGKVVYDQVVTRALGGDEQPTILIHSSFDGNNKNLGRVDSPFANVYGTRVSAGVTATQELHVYSIRSKDGNPILMHQSLDGNNKNLGRPESPFANIYGSIRMAVPSGYTKSNNGYVSLEEYIDHKLGL